MLGKDGMVRLREEVDMVFWKRKRDVMTPEEQVDVVLIAGEEVTRERPQAALKLLDGLKGVTYPLVTFGGEHHERFRRIVMRALGWSGPAPNVRVCPWSRWKGPFTMADVVAFAQEVSEPVLYLYEPPGRLTRGPVVEIEGLEALAEDEQVVMVVIGEANALVRRDLLIGVAGAADLTSEEILQEIADATRKSGLRTLSIVG